MPYFNYKARDGSGKLVEGVGEAIDMNALAHQLMESNITPIDIRPIATEEAPAEAGFDLNKLFEERVRHIDITLFSRQMYNLLKAGIPIMRALAGLQASSENKKMAEVIGKIHQSLDSGRDLSLAFNEHPKVFSSFYVSMIRVGENTGSLEEIFLRLHDHLVFEKFMHEQVKSALRYPAFVMSAMAAAIVIVNIFVIPTFARVFAGFKTELPLITRLLIGFSEFMVKFWPLLLILVIAAIFGFRRWIATKEGRYTWDKFKLNIPIAGKIIRKATLARFTRSFSISSKSGVPIVAAMALIADTVDNAFIADKVAKMSEEIECGDSVYRTAINSKVFTPVVLQMIAVGEESGSLDELMGEIADMYQQEVEYELKTLGAQIEPILIVFLGILILILALGIFLPMWDLGKAAMKH